MYPCSTHQVDRHNPVVGWTSLRGTITYGRINT